MKCAPVNPNLKDDQPKTVTYTSCWQLCSQNTEGQKLFVKYISSIPSTKHINHIIATSAETLLTLYAGLYSLLQAKTMHLGHSEILTLF
jgi:hypothetical protein